MNEIVDWVVNNKEWLFSGVGIVVVAWIWRLFQKRKEGSVSQEIHAGDGSTNVQAGRDVEFTAKSKGEDEEKG